MGEKQRWNRVGFTVRAFENLRMTFSTGATVTRGPWGGALWQLKYQCKAGKQGKQTVSMTTSCCGGETCRDDLSSASACIQRRQRQRSRVRAAARRLWSMHVQQQRFVRTHRVSVVVVMRAMVK